MIDSIHIKLRKELITDRQIENFMKLISIKKVHNHVESGNVHRQGNFKNFNVDISNNAICINGSLPKYYYGNNVQTMKCQDILPALLKLSSELKIPILKGDIKRLDLALTISLDREILHYMRSYIETPGYERNVCNGGGLRYTKNNLVLAFYDKTSDAKKLPHGDFSCNGKDVIRIELRITKRVRSTLIPKSKKLLLVQLMSKGFQDKLCEFWWKHYSAILKKRRIMKYGQIKSWKDVSQYLMAETIQHIGMMGWNQEIKIIANENNWAAWTKCDVRKKSREIWENKLITEPNEYIHELDTKIDQVRHRRT